MVTTLSLLQVVLKEQHLQKILFVTDFVCFNLVQR